MKPVANLMVVITMVCMIALVTSASEEGLSRTSWGRFGWWETHIHSYNRTNIDGLLSYNVTLEGIMGTIRTRTGQQWAGGPPYGVVPMEGHSRLWNIRFTGVGAGRSRLVLSRTWQFSTDPDNNGLDKGWHKPGFDHSQWRNMIVGPISDARYEATRLPEKEKGAGWGAQTVPTSVGKSGAWENQGVEDYNGWAWYRLEAVIPSEWKGEAIFYQCFGIDDEDHTYINGQLIGETFYDPKGNSYVATRRYLIDSKLIKWGQKNTFAVRVFDDHGDGGFTGTSPELVRGEAALWAHSIKPSRAGDAPAYIKKANWVTKWIDLPDYSMTYSLASAMVRVKPKGAGIRINFEAPIRYLAYVGPNGVQVAAASDRANYDMRENWLLLWHGNSVGYKEDMPVLVVLHSKPTKININGGEVTIESKRSSFEIGPPFGLRHFSGSHTERWAKEGVPNDVVAGCRFWSRAALAYPTSHKELYDVDHDREMVTFTQKYDYEIVKDDWSTKPLKIAAIPPIVACLIDADYPGKMISKRTDPGFVSYHGPFAATVDSDTAVYELPIPIEDVFAALATPGQEADLDLLTCATANLYQRWSGWDWKDMGRDSGPIKMLPAEGEEPMDLDKARERALLGKYPVIGLPADHKPGAPIAKVFTSGAQNTSGFVPGLLVVDDRVRPGIIAGIRRLARSMDGMLQDQAFNSGRWRVEVDPTFKMGMTYYSRFRYANLADRYNGEAPYDFTAVAGGVAYGYREAGLWTGQWDFIRKRWHKILQQSDSYWRNHDWASGACDNKDSRPNSSVDITWDHDTGLEALARCAYAIGDEKTYDFLCYLRARLSLTSVAHEAVQQYMQPYLMWPDHWFAGHIGEPYPPFRAGLKPEGGVAMQWLAPYPQGAVNQVPWRFNNANISSPGVGMRWMGMSQPRQARWMWNRMDKYVPDWYDGRLWRSSGDGKPPYNQEVQRSAAANILMVGLFAGISPERIRERFDRLSLTQALRPFYIERMAHSHGRGQLQNLLFTRSSPMWCSAWEPRVIWHGRYDPAKGAATIIVEPGDAPLRFKGGTWIKPLSIAINGKAALLQPTVKQARLNNSWAFRADRQTIYIFSNERGRIELTIRFKPDPNAPKPAPRMVSAQPITAFETNMLNNASFDIPHRNIAKAPFVGAVTGPYLYVNYWLAPDVGAGSSSPLFDGYMRLNGEKTHSAGVSVELFAGKDTQVRQNVPAMPGPHRLVVWAQLARRQWQPDDVELRITAAALNAGVGTIEPLTLADLILAPTQLHQDKWVPIILELDAPPQTNAIQVTISYKPKSGDGKPNLKTPILIDDVSLMRIEQLTGKMTPTIKAQPPAGAEGLAAHWNFDQRADDRKILDVSGNQNHATFAGIGDMVDHHKGKALRFDGSSTVLSINNLRGIDFSTGDFTIAFWININQIVKGAPMVLSLGGEASIYPGVIFQYRSLDNGNGRIETYLALQGKAGYIHSTGHPPNLNDGKWHHMVLSVNRSGQVVTYIDGQAVYHQDIAQYKSAALAGRGALRIGQYQSLPPAMPMLIDDIRIYNKPLTADQVLQVIDDADQ